MSPFGYHPTDSGATTTVVTAEERDALQLAAILARTVTPPPSTGVLPVFFCRNEATCDHWADGPGRLCPVCADPTPLEDIA